MKAARTLPLMTIGALAFAACADASPPDAVESGTPVDEATTAVVAEPAAEEPADALVEGTDYNATTILDCGFDNGPPTRSCNAGVKRHWRDEPDEHLVEVQKPDGRKRAIFFKGTEPYGADSAESDGSAGWDFKTSRDGDRVTIEYGPETYVIVDALITGG